MNFLEITTEFITSIIPNFLVLAFFPLLLLGVFVKWLRDFINKS